MKIDYSKWLIQRAIEHQEELESQAPISLLEHKARKDRERWLERLARIQGKTPPEVA